MLNEQEIRNKILQWESVYNSLSDKTNKTRVEGFIKGLKFVLGEPLRLDVGSKAKNKE